MYVWVEPKEIGQGIQNRNRFGGESSAVAGEGKVSYTKRKAFAK